jgi:SagB-type dehydrogenase family enzyme
VSRREEAEAVRRYHERSTPHPDGYARGPGFLDWANQPEPFRTWAGAPVVELPLAVEDLAWADLHRPGVCAPRSLDRAALGAFFELSLGVTAWKEHGGARWALRANPSSGNLHPTEGYALLPATPSVSAGLYHYLSRDHVLERRFTPSPASADGLARLLPAGAFLVGLASVHWREAWKYGERAFRYCQHDVGHTLASVRYAAAVLGWSARLLEAPGDEDVSALLGLDRDEDFGAVAASDREHPDGLVMVASPSIVDAAVERMEAGLDALRESLRDGDWAGTPNALSPEHVDWEAIEDVAAATDKPRTSVILRDSRRPAPEGPAIPADPSSSGSDGAPRDDSCGEGLRAVSLIRARRSAVSMDGVTAIPATAFFAILDRLLPRPGVPPWDVLPWPSRVHPVVFAHGVDGLARGLYLLARAPGALEDLRKALRPSFLWGAVEGCPPSLPLFLLEPGDTRPLARFASCHQEIASDSSFAVAMLADLRDLDEGPWWYRRLHWEAGVLGQVLYMEAEAAGVRGTGIGCFFDDVVHETLGLDDGRFRDVYHFTVGGGVDDRRLTTAPGYGDAVRRRA